MPSTKHVDVWPEEKEAELGNKKKFSLDDQSPTKNIKFHPISRRERSEFRRSKYGRIGRAWLN